jgi:hypothetical protein
VLIPSLPPFVVMGKGDTLNCSIGFLAALALRQACPDAGLALVPDRIKYAGRLCRIAGGVRPHVTALASRRLSNSAARRI